MASIALPSGRHVRYDDVGFGAAVVLIPGHRNSRTRWLEHLPAFAPYLRVLPIDNRDAGESEPESAPYAVADMAADVVGLLDALGIERAHVVGHSMGTAIARMAAIQWPARVERVILVAGGLPAPGRLRPPLDPADWIADGAARERAAEPGAFSPGFLDAHPDVLQRVGVEEYRNRLTFAGAVRQRAANGSDSPAGKHDQLRQISAPTLIIAGEVDPLVSLASARALAEAIPGAALSVYEGAGHRPHTECPVRFNAEVLAFLGIDVVD